MDPDATLKLIVEAIQDKDYETAFYHTQDLKTWISKDGTLPKIFTPYCTETLDWCRVTMRLCKALDLERIKIKESTND